MATHYVHEDDKIYQEGVTKCLAFDTISGWVSEYVTARLGLGKWCWLKMKGKNGNIWRIVCAFQPGVKPKKTRIGLYTVYDQQIGYHRVRNEIRCAILLFR